MSSASSFLNLFLAFEHFLNNLARWQLSFINPVFFRRSCLVASCFLVWYYCLVACHWRSTPAWMLFIIMECKIAFYTGIGPFMPCIYSSRIKLTWWHIIVISLFFLNICPSHSAKVYRDAHLREEFIQWKLCHLWFF